MTGSMTPLLEHNEQFARAYTPVPLGLPAERVIVVTCVDHRVDPAITLGLKLGDAPSCATQGDASLSPSSRKSPISPSLAGGCSPRSSRKT